MLWAFVRPSCLCKALSIKRSKGGSSSAILPLGPLRAALYCSHRSYQASSTTSSVVFLLPFLLPAFQVRVAHWATRIAAFSTSVGSCGPCRALYPFLFLLLNLVSSLLQAFCTTLFAVALSASGLSPVYNSGVRSRCSKSASLLLRYRSSGGT